MQIVELALILLLLTAVGGVLVRWTKIGLPIFLVLVGVLASLLPGLDTVAVEPEVFLLLFIPPLLFADARVLPRRDLMQVLRPVLLLALGLVVLTVLAVGWFIHWLVPAMPLAVAFVLGAIVTPTDAVATMATTHGLPLPQRVSNIVNAESLLNDATGLVAFKLAVAAAAAASSVTTFDLASSFVLLSGGGAGVGWAVERLGRKAREALIGAGANDPVLQTLLAVLLPYAAYLVAETLHVSGVLAVVVAGLWAGGKEVRGLSAEGRRHSREVWRMLAYVFNGLVFLLLGLQLRHMLAAVGHYEPSSLALLAVALWAFLMALRLAWVWASAYLRYSFDWGWAGGSARPDARRMFIVGWAAVRGSVTLATALSVPLLTATGAAFPERDLVVFLAASTIVLTLLLNGLPLPWLLRRLQAPIDMEGTLEEDAARVAVARAGIIAVEALLPQLTEPGQRAFVQQLSHRYQSKINLRDGPPEQAADQARRIANARHLRRVGIDAERDCLYRLHAQHTINDETVRVIEQELDEREIVSSADPMRG
ncbi:MAG: Na+/H+ antiporter [Leptothrix sp. (in: Bacteria)]|nr:Na+/H+ antiporter [Leptothrix sp. (in: b-proteobacteria)]